MKLLYHSYCCLSMSNWLIAKKCGSSQNKQGLKKLCEMGDKVLRRVGAK